MYYDVNILTLKTSCSMTKSVSSLKSSLLWQIIRFRHCCINMTAVVWRTRFRHQFVTKNILWRFSYILWQICLIIYVTFSTSVRIQTTTVPPILHKVGMATGRVRVGYLWISSLAGSGSGTIPHPHGFGFGFGFSPVDTQWITVSNKNSCFIVYLIITLFI